MSELNVNYKHHKLKFHDDSDNDEIGITRIRDHYEFRYKVDGVDIKIKMDKELAQAIKQLFHDVVI